MATVELQHVGVAEGKARARTASTLPLNIPAFKAILDQRWIAAQTGNYNPDPDMEWLVKEVLKLAPTLNDITTQRAIYYMLRGKFPGRSFRGNELGSDKFYDQLVGTGMEKVQLASGVTMQSLGIWAAPRGYIAGDGTISTQRRGRIPLTAQPTLNFDLADVGSRLQTNARKVIHFEKDAGFGGIVAGDMPKYIEAAFSTSQGQLSEAANKFLRQCEEWGLQVYSIHDADPFGAQMSLLYGLASKNNCYMADEFFPKGVKSLGFFPSIAKLLNLPPEKIDKDSADFRIFDNLNQIVQEKPEMQPEVEAMMTSMRKWEFQALNAIDERAPQIYIIEGLRAKGDEIKYVPDGENLKNRVIGEAKDSVEPTIEVAVNRAVNRALEVVKDEIETSIREAMVNDIEAFRKAAQGVIAELESAPANDYRESVKKELVKNPADYWDTAIGRIANRSFHYDLNIEAEVEVVASVDSVKSDKVTEAMPPETPDMELTKDDIVASIERRIIGQAPKRDKVVEPIRKAFETVFGEPEQEW